MKKILRSILLFLLMMLPSLEVMAASATGSIKVSTTKTVVGNKGTATLTITSDSPIAQIYGTFTCEGLGTKDLTYSVGPADTPGKSKSYTISWTAKSVGTYTCSVNNLEVGVMDGTSDGDWPSVTVASKKITVEKKTSSSNNNSSSNTSGTTSNKKEYSTDNNLKTLTVEGFELSPNFSKDTLEYSLKVDQTIEKVVINATLSDSKAKITGTGEKNLSNGENIFEIKVTAENGNEKIYKIKITSEDLTPIKVKVNDEELTIVKKNNNLIDGLEYYEESIIKINEQEVVSYKNTNTDVTLVLLKNSNNEINYYVYDEVKNTYKEYNYIKVGGVTLQLLEPNNIPNNYKVYELELDNKKINLYKIKKSHKVGLIYGTNVGTGNTGYYVYDKEEETLSKYYDEEVKLYQREVKELENYIMILIGVLALVIIITVVISIKGNRKRKINRHKF